MTTTEPRAVAAGREPTTEPTRELSMEPGEDGGAGRPGRAGPGVRVRILATVLVLAALGLLVAGATTVVLQRDAFDRTVDASLRTEVEEFRQISRDGPDPAAQGDSWASVSDLLEFALKKQAPDRDETFLAMIGGKPAFVPAGERPVNLENEAALVREIAALPPDVAHLRDADTTAGPIRYAVVPAQVGKERGSYVIAIALKRGLGEVTDTAQRYAVVAVASLLVLGVAGWLVAGRLLRPLRALHGAAARISVSDLSERIPAEGRDDIADLARTFNAMLDRLDASFQAQRDALDDAGHELRTPVTVIRGHLELLDPHDPEDVAATRTLLLEETDRTARLIEELILLAKARRPDFVRAEEVDLGGLTEDVLDKARALGDRDWQLDGLARRPVQADPQRLTQALLQLCDNAVKYTGPGDLVAIGSSDGEGVQGPSVWVRDGGPGIDPADADRIFQRFGRAAGADRTEGSGLGLAIVAAIARAHGGTARLEHPPEGGALFRVTLGEMGKERS